MTGLKASTCLYLSCMLLLISRAVTQPVRANQKPDTHSPVQSALLGISRYMNGHTGEATKEGLHHLFTEDPVVDRMEDRFAKSDVDEVEGVDWSNEEAKWNYRSGEWRVLPLPDPSFLSLSISSHFHPSSVLLLTSNETVVIQRDVSGLDDITLHYHYFIEEEKQESGEASIIKVYRDVGGERELLKDEIAAEGWVERNISIPQALNVSNASIVFESRLQHPSSLVALADLKVTSAAMDEALDSGDTLTLSLADNTTSITNTSVPTPSEEINVPEQDRNSTTSELNPLSNSTVESSQNPLEDAEMNNVTEMVSNVPDTEDSTDIPEITRENETSEKIKEQDNVAMNSSTLDTNNTLNATESDGLNSTVILDDGEEENEEEGLVPTTTDMNIEISQSEGVPDSDELNNGTIFIPVTVKEDLIDLPTSYPDSNNSDIRMAIPEDTQANISETTQLLGTSQELTTNSPGTESAEGTTLNASTVISPSGNTTSPVVAADWNTSWQVFQIFVILCVMGLLALVFLYWRRRRRRQDDEVPVFTQTDYQNPTFSMEDAANFLSRVGRNTYKTLD